MKIFIFFFLLGVSGCSLQKVALRGATPIFIQSSEVVMKERSWEFFKEASPGNIKFLEVLWETDKENLGLLSALLKSYAGYAFGVSETLAFEDELKGTEESKWKLDALMYYTRSLDFGLIYLNSKGISRQDLLTLDESFLLKKLQRLSEKDIPPLLYTAQSWGSLINLQKDNIVLVSFVPRVKILFDHVCKVKPDIDNNVCDLFYARYESSRPRMLGGNPEKGAQIYREAMKKNPHNLLLRLSYIQDVLIPAMDKEKFEEEATILKEEFSRWNDLNRDSLQNLSPYRAAAELNLFNAIAQKRFQIIETYKKKIF
jgi:hypothetical protein